jgi:ABC-type multidrug transport system ATPase subunit
MRNRTVILVTHHVDLIIPHCAWVVQLDEGVIAAQGTPEELRKQGLLAATRETGAKEDSEPVGDEIVEQEGKQAAELKEKPARKLVDKEDKAELVNHFRM